MLQHMDIGSHWGQGAVYRAGTLQVYCKEMDKEPPHTHPVYRKYIQNFPANFIAVFPVQEMPSTFTVFQVM